MCSSKGFYHNLNHLENSLELSDSKSEKTLLQEVNFDYTIVKSLKKSIYNEMLTESQIIDRSIDSLKKSKFISTERGKVLIIDDNMFILNSLETSMNKIFKQCNLNIDIIKGTDGSDLIKYVIDDEKMGNKIKCVFIDENMEFINGSEAIDFIRRLEKLNKIKKVNICMISAVNEYNNQSNADFTLIKPISVVDFEILLRKIGLL